ncbi:hypothetical protein FHS85_003853 [Rhodoligotrophos appendicifer]|uniref:hypothetical protein n=1 Tax=Rhodoligotrophos appendicifer TaxID=987056 RepID=UPI00118524CA|nr:hypothetical protein [Rhodoligotrophos appendicifer]
MNAWSDETKYDRIARHVEMIRDSDRWPLSVLRVKSQPWAIEHSHLRFGRITPAQPTTVALESGGVETFRSVEQLVERWAVD